MGIKTESSFKEMGVKIESGLKALRDDMKEAGTKTESGLKESRKEINEELKAMKAETKAELKGVQGSVQLLYLTVGLLVTAMVGPKVGLLEAMKTLYKAEAVLVQQNKEEVQGKKCIFGISST